MNRKDKAIVLLLTPLYIISYGFAKLVNIAEGMPTLEDWRHIMKGEALNG